MIFITKEIAFDFYYKNAMEMIFTIRIHGNFFFYKNALQIILL